MTEEIKELEDCKGEMTPYEYEGIFGCQTQEDPSWFRARFRSKQYRAKKVKWDEIKNQYAKFHPTIMKDPCSTPEAMSFSDAFLRHDVTPIHVASLITIDCGEVDDLQNEVRPGDSCNEIRDPDQLFRQLLAKRALMQSSGYDDIEECLAAEFMITQQIELPKSDYLPNGGYLGFHRDEELNCVTSESFGKGQCDSQGILRRFINKTDCVDGFAGVTDLMWHCDDWEDFIASDDMKECLKGFNPQLFLDGALINEMTKQPLRTVKGVNLVWVSPEGTRHWKVNLKKRYCTETGEIQKYDLMPRGEILAFNFGSSDCSYSPVWGYVPVIDIHKSQTGSIVQSVNAVSRYTKTKVSWHPAGYKQIMQSNMMPFLPYKNSSASLKFGVDLKEETFKLKTDVVPEEVKAANRAASVLLQAKKAQELEAAQKIIESAVKPSSTAKKTSGDK